jgi:phosphoribosyl-ATP pyrophosphohydrolase
MENDWKWLDEAVEDLRAKVGRGGGEAVLAEHAETRALVTEVVDAILATYARMLGFASVEEMAADLERRNLLPLG